MRRLFALLLTLLLALLLAGCGNGFYKIPKEEYRQRVQTLGVLPLMYDNGSTISRGDREDVVTLLRRHNAGKEIRLVNMLREEKAYFDIRSVAGDPEQFFSSLVTGATMRGQGDQAYRSYRFDPQAVRQIADRNLVDGILVVILNGVTRTETRRDRALLSYLEAPYNSILVTAAVVAPTGEIVWEYPGREAFLPLQYPDFDEAYYNKSDAVKIKEITLPGLDRALTESGKGIFNRSSFPNLYQTLFDKLVGELKPGMLNMLKGKQPS
ncbi:hypothetical protein DESUT3_35800 [Desulfuromonas versatilis]|uniref:Lipoprotein n=1 Tax=Desulfuromonas versatilis TaxID=2802975 RepID=A0ABM8I0J2_9BACT|nr:hypothetical protein [Desulfuromonas versatilis]BCR06511.1 hypothetical protein DESUT3_35800 [Desulfuromonas versatilis]